MSKRTKYTGGYVTKTEVIPAGKFTDSTASGVWSIQEALMYTKSEIYPNPANGAGPLSFARAVFGGGRTPSDVNTIDYVEIMTTGNGVDFGDLTNTRSFNNAGMSNGHGGLG